MIRVYTGINVSPCMYQIYEDPKQKNRHHPQNNTNSNQRFSKFDKVWLQESSYK